MFFAASFVFLASPLTPHNNHSPLLTLPLYYIFSDCYVGIDLTVEQCCNMIKDSVPTADKNGKTLECYADPPVGSVSNPVDAGRVIIHTDVNGIVVHIPKNE